jgi:UDP-N-acetyl-D-mannosaminuronic acid dehydrogenase
LAYCPERIAQGYAVRELEKLPQIVAGFSDFAIKQTSKLFGKFTKKIITATIGEAELMKLFSNSMRYIQFAIANQFYMIAEDYGENYEFIRQIMLEDYDRAQGLPSAGFAAGPCLLKDTMQLSAFYSNQFFLGQGAMNINEGLPNYLVNNMKKKFDLEKLTVGILGMTFKADVDDIRDSLSYKLKKILIFNGANVLCSDVYVKDPEFINQSDLIEKSDIIIIGVPHSHYKDITIIDKPLIDIWNITKRK